MRDIQVPQNSVQELRAIVNVDEIVIPSLDVDRQIRLSDPPGASNRPVGRIVRRKQIRIPLRPDQGTGAPDP
jgi:hypothetical protein